MKKIIAVLISLLIITFAIIPVFASGTQNTRNATSIAGKTVTLDGVKGNDEGWSEEPVAYLDKMRGIANDGVKRGEVYISFDDNYVYFFVSIYAEYAAGVADDALYQTYVKASFDNIGEEEINCFPPDDGEIREKFIGKTWTVEATKPSNMNNITDLGCAKNYTEAEGGTYDVECRLPIPDEVKETLTESSYEIKFAVYQGLGAPEGTTLGVYASDITPTEIVTSANDGRTATIGVNLPVINTLPTIVDVSDKDISIDGVMGSDESWASLPYMVLDTLTADGATSIGNIGSKFSGIRYSVDSENIYVFFDTYNMTSERVYLQFAFDGKTAGADGKGNFLIAELDLSENTENVIASLTYGDSLAYAQGDAMFDGVSAATKRTSDKICAELCVSIPENVFDMRLEGAVTVKVGAYEKFSTDAADGYISAGGYNVTAPSIAITLAKDTASLADMLKTWLADSKKTANYENLTGLSVNVFGDDMFAGGGLEEGYTWAALLASKYGWTLNNHGVNGNMVSEFDDIDELPMVKGYRQLPNNSPDLIIVTGGYNDFKNNVPLGESGSRDTKTYIGALNTLIDGLKAKYKDSAIVFVAPWNYTGTNTLSLTYKDYADAMVAACEAKGVYCFKAYDTATSGINMQDADFRAQYAMSADDSYHLNLEGMKLAMPKIETFLNDSMTKWLAGPEEEEDGDDDTDNNESAPEADANDKAEETTGEEDKGGCGSTVAGSIALVAVASLGTCLIRKKKED